MQIDISNHAGHRLRQRGFRERDMDILVQFGTWLDDHRILMLNKDIDREIVRRKREIQTLERLRGCKAVCKGNVIVTVYRPTRARLKREIQSKNLSRLV